MATDNSQHTVLVVDDVPVNILLVKGMLAKQKFNVISANSGQQALDILTHEQPDCILLDILMPNMNGFETTRAIRANIKTRDIPIILLSALNSDSDIKEGMEAGANEFVTKPFVQDRLIASIQNQIKNAAANRKKLEMEPTAASKYDGTMRLLAFVACQKQDQFSRMLTEMALCVPIDFVNDDLLNLTDQSAQGLIDWTVRRMQNYYVRNAKIYPPALPKCLTLLAMCWRIYSMYSYKYLSIGQLRLQTFCSKLNTLALAKRQLACIGCCSVASCTCVVYTVAREVYALVYVDAFHYAIKYLLVIFVAPSKHETRVVSVAIEVE